ncbi:MAG: S41 family peptidase [Candidatus Omnitrophota bacterium]|jgi:carboxyl-terminal processing protease
MFLKKGTFFILVLGVIISGIVFFSISEAKVKRKENLYKQVELFSDALAIIQAEYVDEPDTKNLIYGSLKGMLASLDPYSEFMDPDTFNELKADTEGRYGGLGLEINIKEGFPTVVTPIEDTPAWRAGIKPGDRIVKINNELTRDMSLTDAVKRIRGKPGETVSLTILREPEKKLLELKLVRAMIKMKGVKEAKLLSDGIGYIRLVEFRDSVPPEMNAVIEKLSRSGMTALIIDLRNNPGGSLDSAVRVAERFIEKGKMIVYIRGRIPSQNMEFYSASRHLVLNLPLAILINEGSASGSEIVAGAMQYYKRAVIIGKKSFGKGFVQAVIPLKDGSALRLTTSRYFTPSGKVINGIGIEPDITVEEGNIQLSDNQLLRAIDALKNKK